MTPNPLRRRSVISAITHIFTPHNSSSINPSRTSSPNPQTTTTTTTLSSSTSHTEPTTDSTKSLHTQAERDADLSLATQDLLFAYQLEQPDPRRLGPEAFHAANVAANRAVSARIHQVLQRHNIISAHADDWRIYSDRISRQLPSQLPFLTPSDLHRLVGALFSWEQEQSRWNLIEDRIRDEKRIFEEECNLKGFVRRGSLGDGQQGEEGATRGESGDGEGEGEEAVGDRVQEEARRRMSEEYDYQEVVERHRLAVAHLENSRRTLPSLRETLEQQREGMVDRGTRPPAYGDCHNSVPVMGSPSREDVSLFQDFRRHGATPSPRQSEDEAQVQRQVPALRMEKGGEGVAAS